MPTRVKHLEDGGVIAEFSGRIVVEDITGLNDSLYESPERIRAIKYQLCDFTDVTDVAVDSSEITDLAKQDLEASVANPHMIIALVGGRDLTYGLARMWEAYASGPALETMVFRSREDAESWIRAKLRERP